MTKFRRCASRSSDNATETREQKWESLGNLPALKTFSRCGILAAGGSNVFDYRREAATEAFIAY